MRKLATNKLATSRFIGQRKVMRSQEAKHKQLEVTKFIGHERSKRGIRAWREGGERDIESCGDIHSHVGGVVGTRGEQTWPRRLRHKTGGASLAA